MSKRATANLVCLIAAGAILMGVRSSAFAQATPIVPFDLTDKAQRVTGYNGQELTYLDQSGAPKGSTKSALETIRGNGTRAGYMLSHGGIVPASVRVSVGARSLRANSDFGLDYASGMLVFTEAVRRFESITVSYQYVEGFDATRSLAPASGLAMNFRNTSMNFGYGVSSFNGLDFNSYGMGLTSKLGGGSTLSGLMYFSTPSASNENVAGRTNAQTAGATKRAAAQAKSDHLLSQNLAVNGKAGSFRATYQDVGSSFGGFHAMRQSFAGNADKLGEIAKLEKERGLKRLGFAGDLKLGAQATAGFDWGQVTDGKGGITQHSIALGGKGMSFKYSDIAIDSGFQAFKNLTDAQAAQWAREKGIKRNEIALGLTPTKGSGLNFGQTSLRDASGSLTRQSAAYNAGSLGLTYNRRTTDSKFARLNDLSDAEKNALALDIRRQYNPKATVGEVTQKDREQIGREAGLERTQMGFTSALGKQGSLALNRFSTSDGGGAIQRSTLALSTPAFGVTYLDQRIDRDFSKLGALSDFERSQLANEVGMRRTSLGLNARLGKASSFAYSQSTYGDDTAGMSRQSFAYTGSGVDARLNLASTDRSFARARDIAGLSDAERQSIESERGFKRMDFAANVTLIKGLTLNSYVYNASNAEDALTRNNYRHFAALTPSKSTRISYLTEGQAAGQSGRVTNGQAHTLLTLDHAMSRGMKLNLYSDAVRTIAGEQTASTVTHFAHFETDRSKANNLMAEMKRIQYTGGRFENTTHLDMNLRASKAMSLRLNHLAIDRGADPSATTNTLQMNWQLSKQLAFAGSYALTNTNNDSNAVAKSFSLGGELIRNLNLVGSYTEINQIGKNVRAQSDISLSNAKPVSFLGLRDTTFTFRYAALNDQRKQQTEAVSGKIQAMLGKNQMAFEYGGSLDQKNNSAVSRSFSFVSDRNEKLPLHFDFSYKARNLNRGDLQLVRKYNLALRMDKSTNLTYTYSSLPEDGAGNMQPLKSSAFSLKRSLGASRTFSLDYTTGRNFAQGTAVRKLGAVLAGKLDKLSAFQAGYSVDLSTLNGQNTNAHTVSLNFDRRVNADNVLAFGAAYTMNRNGQGNDVQGTVEFKSRF